MSLSADASMLVVLLSLVFSTLTSVSSVPTGNYYGLSDVTVQAGQDAVFRFNYGRELRVNDEVCWVELKTSKTVFSRKLDRKSDGFFVNTTLPGQFDLVVRKANASMAGYYTVHVKGNERVSVTAELRVVESVSCAALVDRNVTMVCTVVFAHHGRRRHHVHPDVHVQWSESATCANSSGSSVVEPEEPQRHHDRVVVASTCVTPLDRLPELTSRTCTVTFQHGNRRSSVGDQFSMECSVDVRFGEVNRTSDHAPHGPECYSAQQDPGAASNAAGTRTVWTSDFWLGTMTCVVLCVKYGDILS